jgi:molybdate transport system ATP-binding protein
LQRTSPGERRIEFERVVTVLDLGAFLSRRPGALSGGEQQRVAVGRALLGSPQLLLLDEPLASLDARRKREILPFVARLHEAFGIPIVYVSHAVGEVLQLATTVVLLAAGRIVATGPVQEIFSRLDLRPALAPTGAGCVLDTKVVEHEPEYGLTRVEFAGHLLEVPHREAARGAALRVHVLPRDVTLHVSPPGGRTSALNIVPATVMEIAASAPGDWSVEVRLDAGSPFVARITRKSLSSLGLAPGQPVWAQIKAAALAEEWTE